MIEDWRCIEDLFHKALSLRAEERAAYLTGACAGDETLRNEVEALMTAFENDGDLLEQPVFDLGMHVLSSDSSQAAPANSSVGFYNLLKLLREGGMGRVYLAEDVRLNRKVALKFMSDGLAHDGWAKRQLVREAQAAAMLDHPSINRRICGVRGTSYSVRVFVVFTS